MSSAEEVKALQASLLREAVKSKKFPKNQYKALNPKTAVQNHCKKRQYQTTAETECMTDANGQWLHESEIGGPRFLNNPEFAELVCASGQLASRPSEFTALAEKNIKQYYFTWETVRESHMGASWLAEQKVIKRKAPVEKIESPEKKRMSELTTQKSTLLRKLKCVIDKITNELKGLENDLFESLLEKGLPMQMQSWCLAKIHPMSEKAALAHTFYVSTIMEVYVPSTMTEVELATLFMYQPLWRCMCHQP